MLAESKGLFDIREILSSDHYAVLCACTERTVGRDGRSLQGRPVTLKVLKHDLQDRNLLLRARDEARLLGNIRHPNIVQVFRMHTFDRTPVVEMEPLRGLTVEQILARNPKGLALEDAVKIARRVSVALDDAFLARNEEDGSPMRIIHRNLQSSNVLVTVDGTVKIMDFFLASGDFPSRQAVSFELPPHAQKFPAPELGFAKPSPAVDVYAIGCLLYELVTGQAITVLPVPETHDGKVAEFCQRMNPECPYPLLVARIRELVRSMVRYEPEKRPTHRQVADVLEDVLEFMECAFGLQNFARIKVLPTWESRRVTEPRAHPEYAHVEFLERRMPDTTDGAGLNLTADQVEKQIWRVLSSDDWPEHLGELKELVVSTGHRPTAPFVAVLDRHSVPGWKFWSRESTAEELCAALSMLVRCSDPAVLERVRALADHADANVAKAAKYVLSRSPH